MVNSKEDFSDEDLQKILEQAKRIEFERLQHKTTIPTVFIKELLDSPPNYLLSHNFFDVGYKDRKKISAIHNLIEKIENIAIKYCRELLEEQDYYVNFEQEQPIMYAGFGIHIIFDHKDLYLESKELKCLNFHKLCQCIKLKAFTRLYFENRQYEASFYCVRLASYVFGAGTNEVSGDNDFQKKLSRSNKEKANKRWSKHNQTRPEKKKQYLEIMNQQNFTAFAETAEYIKQHIETDKKPSYDTIKRWLSQANKGNFS
ncbi:hypothetical protein ACTXJ2_06755 [Psychrobacter alimentarius]|uniref:hypothetical protein n=1 Tax=Psychrobacter TaxID=497 RepID=UPI000BAA9704|nr:hypothetical protein [Psychrobacter sp. JB193]PAT64359.1 hypothetical protein CIK80_04510 [Psychrobacter sp. JB193]